MDPYDVPASGIVLDEDRGHLPYRLVHGEALVAAAAWAVGAAGVDLLDQTTPWEVAVDRGYPLLLHDALCPMTPPDFLARCVEIADRRDVVVVGVRPVTDTVAPVSDGVLGPPVDRSGLASVASPVVVPAEVVASMPDWPQPLDAPARLVAALRHSAEVVLLEAPPAARRVVDESDLALLEALA
jgi:2-C-methyl-D-erythritol 4-phosphate cytidylyltransferase